MARWAFELKSDPKEIGDSYTPASAEEMRQSLLEQHGDQLVVKINGEESDRNTPLC